MSAQKLSIPACIAGAPIIPTSIRYKNDVTSASYALPEKITETTKGILTKLGNKKVKLYQAEFSNKKLTTITEFQHGKKIMFYGGTDLENVLRQITKFKIFSPHPSLANVVFAYRGKKSAQLNQILADLGFVTGGQMSEKTDANAVMTLGHFPRVLMKQFENLLKDKGITPKNRGLLEDINEEPIAERIIKLGNIYYRYEWLDENRKDFIFFPDGRLKEIVFPLSRQRTVDFTWNLYNLGRRVFKLRSGGNPFSFKFLPDTELAYFLNGRLIEKKKFPLMAVQVFLKHLEEFTERLMQYGYIGKIGAPKEERAVIADTAQNLKEGISQYAGDKKRGFDEFVICNPKSDPETKKNWKEFLKRSREKP